MKVVFVISQLLIWFYFVSTERVYFYDCSYDGFKCTKYSGKIIGITFECPEDVFDITFHINDFRSPGTTETLEIKNCGTVTILTGSTKKSDNIQNLFISNIHNLIIKRLMNDNMLPPIVTFQNISFIQEIPFGTFTQSENQCDQQVDFQYIHFQNVTIDTIQSNAFFDLNQLTNFSFVNVNIKTIQTFGIRVNLGHKGTFQIVNSTINVIESLGVQVYAKKSVFSRNKLTDVHPNAINGTMDDFYFTDNFVKTLHPYSFSLLATNIYILRNKFMKLKTYALERLSPGVIQPTIHTNFGKLKFVYDFSKNILNDVEAGGLHPDYTSYENVMHKLTFRRNRFSCSCEHLGWFAALGQGGNTTPLKSFYKMVLDEFNDNVCDRPFIKPCIFPIKKLNIGIYQDLCLIGYNVEDLCENESVGMAMGRLASEAVKQPTFLTTSTRFPIPLWLGR